ncbi:MAG: hypothetical protein U5Q16_00795 [Gammaproteobacteria bacterium]|nr:hypothetical protein [Gammaproteobacteria bacterium]
MALLTVWAAYGFVANASADGEAGLRAELERCGRIPESSARLRCYDDLLDNAASGEQRFGGDSITMPAPQPSDDGRDDVEEIESSIERLERRPRGEYVFHLANGQVWTEIASGRTRYRTGLEVKIERTPLGAYMLSTPAGRATRVRRIE